MPLTPEQIKEYRNKYAIGSNPQTIQPVENKPNPIISALKGETSFPANGGGLNTTATPENIAKTFGNIPSSTAKLVRGSVAPVNPLDTESPLNVGANVVKSTSALHDIYKDRGAAQGTKDILGGFADTYLKIGESIYGGLDKAYNALLDDPKKAIADSTEYLAKIGIEDPMFIPTLLYGGGKTVAGKTDDLISRTAAPITRGADTSFAGMTEGAVTKIKTTADNISNTLRPTPEIIAAERQANMAKGFAEQNTRLKTADRSFNENTITRKTPEGKPLIITPIDTFSKYNISPLIEKGSIQMGDYKMGTGELGKIRTKVSEFDTQIDSIMKGNQSPINISEMEFKAFENVMKNEDFKLSGTVGANVTKLEAKFKDFKNTYGDTISAEEVNNMRKKANYDFDPETQDISRIIGDTARDYVYKASPEAQGLLQKQGELLAARKYAQSINGTKVTGGRLGTMALRTTGAIIGSTLPNVPIVGPIIGAVGGEFASRALQQSQFKSLWTETRALIQRSNTSQQTNSAKTIPNTATINQSKVKTDNNTAPITNTSKRIINNSVPQKKGFIQRAVDKFKSTPNKQGGFISVGSFKAEAMKFLKKVPPYSLLKDLETFINVVRNKKEVPYKNFEVDLISQMEKMGVDLPRKRSQVADFFDEILSRARKGK